MTAPSEELSAVDPASPADAECADLAAFIDASPSPFHAVATVADRLRRAGFTELTEDAAWESVDRGLVRRGGALVAWAAPPEASPATPMRLIGAHTDSPNLRIKPQPDAGSGGIAQLGVEVYGGALLNSWLDRDLGMSGRVVVGGPAEGRVLEERLVVVDRPVCRVPQLAIHLDRDIHERGLKLDKQRHLAPMWAQGDPEPGAFGRWLAAELGVEPGEIAGWDLMLHDLTPSQRIGRDREWLAAPRIDNLASCHAGMQALIGAGGSGATVSVLVLFDHEEVGSMSATGAQGALLSTLLERRHRAAGGSREEHLRSLVGSVCISADGAHATHPNHRDRHEPNHQIALNAGPVIKRNANERYATSAIGHAIAADACAAAGVPHQLFVNRTDLACGSTIGPLTAANMGITTVDMGIPQLSMHSARELCGAQDPSMLVAALSAFVGT